MKFNFFKHKKKEDSSKTFDGRFISDEEIEEFIKPKQESFIKKEFKEIDDMMKNIKQYVD